MCVGATELFGSEGPDPAPVGERVPVTTALSACPLADSEGSAVFSSRISAAVPEAGQVAEGAEGAAAVARLGDAENELLTLDRPGTAGFADLDATPDDQPQAFVAAASGPVAPGFTSAVTSVFDVSDQRGLAGQTCPEPGTEFWFIGTVADAEHLSMLNLVNAESAAAQFDVEFYGPDGFIDTPSSRQRTLPPGSSAQMLLHTVIETDGGKVGTSLAVHVVVRVGRVAAGIRDQQAPDGDPAGIDWLQPVEDPLTNGVIPGIPGGPGERTLYLFAPGPEGALVKIQFAGPNGIFAPVGSEGQELATVSVAGNQLTALDLRDSAQGERFSVLINADRPVIGVIRIGTGGETPEYGYVAMTPQLGGPSVVADGREGKGYTSSLLLTAPAADATVALTALIPGEEPKPLEPVTIRAGRTEEFVIEDVGAPEFAIVVTPQPGSGPVYGSRSLTKSADAGDFLTIEALTPTRATTLVPRVISDLSAGLRRAEVG